MKICGIVAEYNPFHNGHAYHARRLRQITGCDAIVAVMSGHFVQRGEPACTDKWLRVQMALRGGVDAVLELPTFYALQNAEIFARGAIGVLHRAGIDCLGFGSETGDLPNMERISRQWGGEGEDHAARRALRRNLKQGMPLPLAHAHALRPDAPLQAPPNDVLGAMYMRAARY